MSDALNYLVKARPDAVGHYFAFLKACGTQLDPKTRDLISVISKVHSQTERGLRQYLGRALREGCTPAEVLDALLMAFPILGLAKIVWAVDIILAMDLPEFQPGALGAAGEWHDVLATRASRSAKRSASNATAAASSSTVPKRSGASTTAAARTRPPISRTSRWRVARSPAPARVGLRHPQRRLHQERQQPAQALAQQGRQGPLAGELVTPPPFLPHHTHRSKETGHESSQALAQAHPDRRGLRRTVGRWATNGMNMEGYGPISTGMGGASRPSTTAPPRWRRTRPRWR